MKKMLFLLALGAVSPAFQVPVEAQTQAQTPAPVADAEAPFVWRLNLRAGQKFLTTTETSTQTTQQIPAMPGAEATPATETRMQNRVVTELSVLSSDDKGARVETLYREMTQNIQVKQGDKVIFDSATAPVEIKGTDDINDISKAIVGARISYLLSPSGGVSEIEGVEAYLQRIADAVKAATPVTAAIQKSMIADFLAPETLRKSLEGLYLSMPTQPIARGASWQSLLVLPVTGTSFTIQNQNTFVSRAKAQIEIAQSGEFSTDGGAAIKIPLPTAPDKDKPAPLMQMDLQGTSTGEITVDETSGITLSSDITQDMAGEIVILGLTGRGSSLTMPMKMKSQIKVKTEKIPAAP